MTDQLLWNPKAHRLFISMFYNNVEYLLPMLLKLSTRHAMLSVTYLN